MENSLLLMSFNTLEYTFQKSLRNIRYDQKKSLETFLDKASERLIKKQKTMQNFANLFKTGEEYLKTIEEEKENCSDYKTIQLSYNTAHLNFRR